MFVGYVQVFLNRKVTLLKSTALVAYSAHVMLLKFSASSWPLLTENEHSLVLNLFVSHRVKKVDKER